MYSVVWYTRTMGMCGECHSSFINFLFFSPGHKLSYGLTSSGVFFIIKS